MNETEREEMKGYQVRTEVEILRERLAELEERIAKLEGGQNG
jgi:polyhydroxyalkanoate synthesis regulator phasin